MHKNSKNKNKRKGGHEREQEKNKKLLSVTGQKCEKINSYFKEVGEPVNEKQETFSIEQKINDVDPGTFNTNNAAILIVDNQKQGLNKKQPNSTISVIDDHVEASIDFEKQGFEKFKRPLPNHLDYFFNVHPIQPIDQAKFFPFDYKKVFFKKMMH
ncbi:uncharacterized protein LOC112682380 isoform X2 [Sipha flava]|uniref:Uncharacterized protein LOC112682380 isoform X2 n=1 Tax=Sipha flava TaxID=143950 RepID=A0A2S2Q3Z0_9HEMI|nr:uncharacterized protein LOC112682380 isoform X2 [Sipha flava]